MKPLGSFPRVRLAHLPTPLQELPNLTRLLGGPRIFMKRDDLTGLAFGGNKTRKLEYLMGDALQQKADSIVTGAYFQSNWCTQAAAAARRLGLKIVLVKMGPREGYDPPDYDGNHLLHFLQGAEIKVVKPEDDQRTKEEAMEELKSSGHRPYFLAAAGSTPLGVVGYIHGVLELTQQAVERGIPIHYLIHSTGTGGTQAGLVIGARLFRTGMKIIGITNGSRPEGEQIQKVSQVIGETLDSLRLDLAIPEGDLMAHDQYAGGGYGVLTEGSIAAIQLLAETEGIFLDPVYTGPAMSGLIDLCRKGVFTREEVVVFLHTGGTAALFPYKAPVKSQVLEKTLVWTVPPWSPLSKAEGPAG